MTVQDIGMVVAVVLFTSVKLALEVVLSANDALDFLGPSGGGGA